LLHFVLLQRPYNSFGQPDPRAYVDGDFVFADTKTVFNQLVVYWEYHDCFALF
jgi:hypothetical protein